MKKRAKGGGLIGGARYEDGDIDWIEEGRGRGGGVSVNSRPNLASGSGLS